MRTAFALIVCYILGSIPWGYIVIRLLKGTDIRSAGSGNIGATNAARAGGKAAGVITLLLDMLKGFFAVTLVPAIFNIHSDAAAAWCMLAVIAGHNWTVFLRFRGGKGVAAAAGAFIGVLPKVFMSGLCIWAAVFAAFRYVSLASIAASASVPVFTILYNEPFPFKVIAFIISVLGIARHKENIKRLLNGAERRFKV